MKINVTLPFDHIDKPEEFLQPEAVVEIAQLIERLGFDGGNVTDHPCPTGRWLDAGGHYAQDPFVMLSLGRSSDYQDPPANRHSGTALSQPPQVVLGGLIPPGGKPNSAELIDRIGQFAAMRVSGAAVAVDGRSRAEWCDNAARFAAVVLAKI